MSEKTRLIAQCKRIDPGFRIEEAVVPQGSMFRVCFSDGTTMHMQFPKGTYSRAQIQNIKLQMLREALIALRFVPKPQEPVVMGAAACITPMPEDLPRISTDHLFPRQA